MTGLRPCALLASAALALAGCERSETFGISLDPDPFDIVTPEGSVSGLGAVTIDPNLLGGEDYSDHKDEIDDVALKLLSLEIVSVNATLPTPNGLPANAATQLTTATLVVRDDVSQAVHAYAVDPARLPLTIYAGASYDLGVIKPVVAGDPGIDAFLTEILKAGHVFSVAASGAIDQAPVNITCRLRLDVDLNCTVGWP
jgi:hypothetical protein